MVLQNIVNHNGSHFNVELADVQDDAQEAISKSGAYTRLQAGDIEDGTISQPKKKTSNSDGWKRTLQDYLDRVSSLLEPKLKRMTILVWSLWFTTSAAYT